jgi:hypothetical protein
LRPQNSLANVAGNDAAVDVVRNQAHLPMRKDLPDFAPAITRTAMRSRCCAIRAMSAASRSKLPNHSKPARIAPGWA